MATSSGPLQGDALLTAMSGEMAALHERHHKRPPGTTTTQLMGDDLLACVLSGVYTDVAKTLTEVERDVIVRDSRSAFQTAMEPRLIEIVERLSGRSVLHFISSHIVGPDLEIELFFLGDPA